MTGFPPDVSAAILMRDGGQCAMAGAPGCPGHQATEANHRLNRGMGGSSAVGINDPSNGCAMEHVCNWAIEADAPFREEALRRGVKLETGQDPTSTPLWSPFYGQWVLLLPRGLHLTGVTNPLLDARLAEQWCPPPDNPSTLTS